MSITEIEKEISKYSEISGLSKTDLKKLCLERGLKDLKENGITLNKPTSEEEAA